MKKLLFNVLLFVLSLFLITGCSFETTIKGEFLLENTFKLKREYENGVQCSDEDRWFMFSSTLTMHSNEKYELVLNYKIGDKKEFNGEYKIYVGNIGHSGEGYFNLDSESIKLIFQASYFLIFELPVNYNPVGNKGIHTLYFQRGSHESIVKKDN